MFISCWKLLFFICPTHFTWLLFLITLIFCVCLVYRINSNGKTFKIKASFKVKAEYLTLQLLNVYLVMKEIRVYKLMVHSSELRLHRKQLIQSQFLCFVVSVIFQEPLQILVSSSSSWQDPSAPPGCVQTNFSCVLATTFNGCSVIFIITMIYELKWTLWHFICTQKQKLDCLLWLVANNSNRTPI